jgi:hypothetical protein
VWHTIQPFLRWRGWQPANLTTAYHYHGLQTELAVSTIFDTFASHEARHCWQYLNGLADADGDTLLTSPPPLADALRDAPLGSGPGDNLEFDFFGDGIDDRPGHPEWVGAAKERDPVRFSARATNLQLACSAIPVFTFAGMYPKLDEVKQAYVDRQGNLGAVTDLPGATIRIDYAPPGTAGSCANDPLTWRPLTIIWSNAKGLFQYPATTPGVYRATLLRPAECLPATMCYWHEVR